MTADASSADSASCGSFWTDDVMLVSRKDFFLGGGFLKNIYIYVSHICFDSGDFNMRMFYVEKQVMGMEQKIEIDFRPRRLAFILATQVFCN